jgi:hypothetical protein
MGVTMMIVGTVCLLASFFMLLRLVAELTRFIADLRRTLPRMEARVERAVVALETMAKETKETLDESDRVTKGITKLWPFNLLLG